LCAKHRIDCPYVTIQCSYIDELEKSEDGEKGNYTCEESFPGAEAIMHTSEEADLEDSIDDSSDRKQATNFGRCPTQSTI
jgi:hypothetical protein